MNPILPKLSKRFLSIKAPHFRRFLFDRIDFSSRLIGIIGGRGSGKTTLMHQYAKSCGWRPSQILYISCDHPALVDTDLYEIAETFEAHGGRLLLLDEIHKIRKFSAHIKAIYDFTRLQILFSGSSAMSIEHEIGDLSRRAVIYRLPVLSFREYLALERIERFPTYTLEEILRHHEDIVVEITEKVKPLEHFGAYLEHGAYPFFKEGVSTYPNKLLEVVRATIESDLAAIFHINQEKLDALKKVLYILCTTTPYELNRSKLSAGVGVAWSTLSKYLDYMQKGALIHILRGSKGFKTLHVPEKILLANPNLFTVLCARGDAGSVRESFFVSQLTTDHTVYYHDKGDFLIDERVVVEVGGRRKDTSQIAEVEGYLAIDGIESGYGRRVPLWLFGFLY